MSQDDDERGTVTGRLPSQPKIQFLKPPGIDDELTKRIEQLRGKFGFITGIDYGAMEMAVISAMKHGKGVVVIDSLPDKLSGYKADFVALDEFMHPDYCYFDEESVYKYAEPQRETFELLDKPKLKQNGRSAVYLKHNKVRKRR